jgi:ParB family chromosome partitioning protein
MAKTAKEGTRANIYYLPPEKLKLVTDKASDLFDPRVNEPPSEEFVANIKHFGVLEPVGCRKNPETAELEVVFGRKRVMACLQANKELKKEGAPLLQVPIVFKRGDGATMVEMMVSENEAREADSPTHRAAKMAKLLDKGRSEAEVARSFCVSIGTVKNMIALMEAPKAIRDEADRGGITVSEAYKLSKLEPADAKERLAELKKVAPKKEKGKRKKGTAKKARAIVSGGAAEVRSRKEIETMREAISDNVMAPGEIKRVLDCVFAWVLGDDEVLTEFLESDEPKAAEG